VLMAPESDAGHVSALKKWAAYAQEARLPRGRLLQPEEQDYHLFHSWLLGPNRTVGGTTAQTYLNSLPTALMRLRREHFGAPKPHTKRMKRALLQGARHVAPMRKQVRHPARLDVLARLCDDTAIPQQVRDACAFMYRTGARGIDVFPKPANRHDPVRPIRFTDVHMGGTHAYITFGREKTAKREGGHHKRTAIAPAKTACAMAAVLRARARHGGAPPPSALLFPDVTAAAVTAALRKYSLTISTHSLRQGAITGVRARGGDFVDVRQMGRFNKSDSVFIYLENPHERVTAQQAAEKGQAAPQAAQAAPPVAVPAPQPAAEQHDSDGADSADTNGVADACPAPATGQVWHIVGTPQIRYLLALRQNGGARGYAYREDDGARIDISTSATATYMPFDDFTAAYMKNFSHRFEHVDEEHHGQLAEDQRDLRFTAAPVPGLPARDGHGDAVLQRDEDSPDSDTDNGSENTQTAAEEDEGGAEAPQWAPAAAAAFQPAGNAAAAPGAPSAPAAPPPRRGSRVRKKRQPYEG